MIIDGIFVANHYVLIDKHFDQNGNVSARQLIDTNDPTLITLLTSLSANATLHAQHGFDITSQLPGEVAPKSRWQRIKEAKTQPGVHPNFAALNLL